MNENKCLKKHNDDDRNESSDMQKYIGKVKWYRNSKATTKTTQNFTKTYLAAESNFEEEVQYGIW